MRNVKYHGQAGRTGRVVLSTYEDPSGIFQYDAKSGGSEGGRIGCENWVILSLKKRQTNFSIPIKIGEP